MRNYPYGSVYKVTREDDAATIRRDFEMMRDSGMDTVVIWPPAYYWEEKTKDYPFATGKMILRLAQEIGLHVIMEMAGQLSVFEYIPDCEMKPEYYALTEGGTREWAQPSFGFLNYFHPEVKEKICAFYRAAALAYRDEPALLAYDVFNETMFRSFDGYTMDAFRVWLQKKYGTIESLNAVWERTYTDFSQVDYDKHKWMSIMPRADYCAFRKASIGMILDPWCDAIRSVDTVHPLIADNIHSQLALCGSYDRPQDDYDLKRHVDEIGMSFYPKGVGGVMAPAMRHQVFSGYYNASQEEGFFISEMQTHIQALFNPTTAVRPWELKQWCYEAYASGAKGLIYWMWRPFSKGLQTMGRGLVDYRGRETPRLSMAKEIGEQFRKYGVLKPVRARVGIVYDPLCEDFQRAYTEAYGVDQQIYLTSIYGAYKMLFDRNIPCDMIRMEEIEKYDAIILSNKLVLTHGEAEKLSQYLQKGGHCIADGKFGIVDETSMVYHDLPGGYANALTGLDLLDTDYEGLAFDGGNGYYCRELCAVKDAQILAKFEDGTCAVSQRKHGAGKFSVFNTFAFYGYAKGNDGCAAWTEKLLGVLPVCDNCELKVKFASNAEDTVAVVFNYTERTQSGIVSFGEKHWTLDVPAHEVLILT